MARITNATVAELARQHHRLKVGIAASAAELKAVDEQLLAELARRKTEAITAEKITVTRTVRRTRRFNVAVLRARLSAAVFAELAPATVTAGDFDAAVKAGTIPADVAAAALDGHDESSPSIAVTLAV